MKNFLVQIWAYNYHAKFNVVAEDNPDSIENSILDKLGKKDVKWEYLGERTLAASTCFALAIDLANAFV